MALRDRMVGWSQDKTMDLHQKEWEDETLSVEREWLAWAKMKLWVSPKKGRGGIIIWFRDSEVIAGDGKGYRITRWTSRRIRRGRFEWPLRVKTGEAGLDWVGPEARWTKQCPNNWCQLLIMSYGFHAWRLRCIAYCGDCLYYTLCRSLSTDVNFLSSSPAFKPSTTTSSSFHWLLDNIRFEPSIKPADRKNLH